MDALKEWVKGLVLLALLASCLELMLPMGSMKKYVKMTMGLLIVLATLKPVFGFLGQPVTVTAELFDEQPQAGLPTMGEIMARAEEFKAKNAALAAAQVEAGLTAEAVRAAQAVPGVASAAALAEVRQEAGGEVKVAAVTVRVVPGAPGGVKPVEPVAPVGGGKPRAPRTLTAEEQKLAAAVRQAVAGRLGIGATAVRVQIEQSAGR